MNSPLRIDAVEVDGGGHIGMTICPGKQGDSKFGDPWRRDLRSDLKFIRLWGATSLVTVMEQEEMRRLGVANLESAAAHCGLEWIHLPMKDGGLPDEGFVKSWPFIAFGLIAGLRGARKVVIHCRGGLGRTGLVSCLLLIEMGESPEAALTRIREARPGAVETSAQEAFVLSYRANPQIGDWLEEAALDAELGIGDW